MTRFQKGKYIISIPLPDNGHTAYYYSRTLKPGVYELYYSLCCDNFLTCSHSGKSAIVRGKRNEISMDSGYDGYHTGPIGTYYVDSIYPEAFDTPEQAELARKLLT